MNKVHATRTPQQRRCEKKTPRNSSDDPASSGDDNKESVRVFCRIKPLVDPDEVSCIRLLSSSELVLATPPTNVKLPRKEVHCNFRYIFSAYASQQEVYQHVALPLLTDLLHGRNALLFTYGVTGSGKTFTLTGEPNDPGIMPRCIYTVFNTIGALQAPKYIIKSDRMNGFEIQSEVDARQDRMNEGRVNGAAARTPSSVKLTGVNNNRKLLSSKIVYKNDSSRILEINENCLYSVFISYVEIYNNVAFDLLDETTGGKFAENKILREDSNRNMYVNGVVEVEVKSAEEAFELFNAGQKRKRMAITALNSDSSRSHSIFNIRVVKCEQNQTIIPDCNLIQVSQLSLVDLAGSERTNRTQNTGNRLREASKINNSLMSLRTCLEILRENQLTGSNKLVPYRDSRLTHLFKNYFEGEGRVEMIVCVNPSADDFEENLQVMRFAEMTRDVKVAKSEGKLTPCIVRKTIQKKTPSNGAAERIKLLLPAATTPQLPSLLLGPKWPDNTRFNFKNPDDATAVALSRLVTVVETRKNRLSAILSGEFEERAKHFRNRLVDLEQELILNRNEAKNSKLILSKEKQHTAFLQSKLSDMETKQIDLNARIAQLENTNRALNQKIAEKDMKINKTVLESERNKQKNALVNEKMTQELDAKLRRQRDHLTTTMKVKDRKIQEVRKILDAADHTFGVEELEEKVVNGNNNMNQGCQTPRQQHVPRRPPITKSTPRSRRSRSVGDVWLEHDSIRPIPLSTVLQPSIKKRKSVTKLTKASDITNPKQSKYCLITQEQRGGDGAGGVAASETRVYKGDIVATCSGGAQVIFNDVERLRQSSPTNISSSGDV